MEVTHRPICVGLPTSESIQNSFKKLFLEDILRRLFMLPKGIFDIFVFRKTFFFLNILLQSHFGSKMHKGSIFSSSKRSLFYLCSTISRPLQLTMNIESPIIRSSFWIVCHGTNILVGKTQIYICFCRLKTMTVIKPIDVCAFLLSFWSYPSWI